VEFNGVTKVAGVNTALELIRDLYVNKTIVMPNLISLDFSTIPPAYMVIVEHPVGAAYYEYHIADNVDLAKGYKKVENNVRIPFEGAKVGPLKGVDGVGNPAITTRSGRYIVNDLDVPITSAADFFPLQFYTEADDKNPIAGRYDLPLQLNLAAGEVYIFPPNDEIHDAVFAGDARIGHIEAYADKYISVIRLCK
jgi:hypothetical protein